RWPAKIAQNWVDSSSIVSALDLLPSLVDIAGGNLEVDEPFDGENRAMVLRGEASPRKNPLLWEYGRNNAFFNFPQAPNRSHSFTYREGLWKFLKYEVVFSIVL